MKKAKLSKLPIVLLIIAAVIVGLFVFSFLGYIHAIPKSATQPSEPAATETSEKFLTYDNPADGVKIKYPNDWTKNSQVTGSIVLFLSPKESASDTSATVGISTEDLSAQPMTLDEYTEFSIEQLKQLAPDAEFLDSSATTLAGNTAHKVVYTIKQGEYTLKAMQVYTIKDNTAYILSYVTEINKYDDFLNTAQEMVNSFEII